MSDEVRMSAHAHRWIIVEIRALVELNDAHERVPVDLRAQLRCHTCSASMHNISMVQLGDLIQADQVRGDSIAQWASTGRLFQ